MISWDVRPHPKLGTLEVRCLDAQTRRRCRGPSCPYPLPSLAVHEANATPPSPPPPEVLAEASFARFVMASQSGLSSMGGGARPGKSHPMPC